MNQTLKEDLIRNENNLDRDQIYQIVYNHLAEQHPEVSEIEQEANQEVDDIISQQEDNTNE